MAEELILTIDFGTQSVRAIVFDPSGTLVAKSQVALDDYTSPQPGWMEHEVEALWQALCRACQQLWAQNSFDPALVRGLVITSQRATVVNLDKAGQPLRPAIIWADQRRARAPGKQPAPVKLAFRALGLVETIQAFEEQAESNWIAQNQPDVWAATDKFLLLSGYLTYRMTGRMADSIGAQVGYIPFDFKQQDWCGPRDWKWASLGIKRSMLPELVRPGEQIGTVTAEAASETGIAADLPVIAGASDKACEVIGSGATSPHIGAISAGTTATFNVTSTRYFEAVPLVPPYAAALPGSFNIEAQVMRGYWMVSWFARQFGLAERLRGEGEGKPAEAYFDELIASTPPGAQGLMLQPFWNPGIRDPGPEARGSIVGFTDSHTRAHLYRAIIEGLTYALRSGKEAIERRGKVAITTLRVAGGGSQSDGVMQIIADIFNLPAQRAAHYEASGLGAAVIGWVGLGHYPDFDAAFAAMIDEGRCFQPDPATAALYDQLYREVYAKLYPQVKPLFRAMQRIGL